MLNFKLVCGVGWNDANYEVQPRGEAPCPYYKTWARMLHRITSHKNYLSVSICKDWLVFSNFKGWMTNQPWQGRDLDKDLKVLGSKEYSPETCAFIPHRINSIMLNFKKVKGDLPKGVTYTKRKGRLGKPYRALVSDGAGNYRHLGYFDNIIEAHKAWKLGKSQVIAESLLWWEESDKESFSQDIANNLYDIAESLKIPNVICVGNPWVEF